MSNREIEIQNMLNESKKINNLIKRKSVDCLKTMKHLKSIKGTIFKQTHLRSYSVMDQEFIKHEG